MADCIQQIRIDEITVPPGQRELRNLDELINSIQTLGLLQPVLVVPEGSHYRLIAGWHRYTACQRLGWLEIPANILALDDPHVELAKIDENLIRQQLTILERGEQYRRRKEIYETLHPETKHGNGPGRGNQEKKRNQFVSFTADTASKIGCTPRTIQQEVQIATKLSNEVKESIRSLPIANKKNELLALSRLPHKTQEALVSQLVSGGAKSLREAQRALEEDTGSTDSKPATRRGSRAQTSTPQPTGVKIDGEDRDTLLHTVTAHFQQSCAISGSHIAGRPAADVMAERLAALPWPELVLLRALVGGQVQEAVASWLAAVRADLQSGVDPFEGGMEPDRNGDSADAPGVQPASGDDRAKTAAFPDVAASPSTVDSACSNGQGTRATVMAVRGDDGADAKVRADDNQRPCQRDGEENPPPEEVPRVREEKKQSKSGSQEAYFDGSSRLISPKPMGSTSANDLPTANVPMTASTASLPPCPRCGSSTTWPLPGGRPGRYSCLESACMHNFDPLKPEDGSSTQSAVSSHNTSQTASGEKPDDSWVGDQQQNPPAPGSATDPRTQDGSDSEPNEATVSSTAGAEAFADEDTAHHPPLAGPHDEGEASQHEGREMA
jgi:ParB-like nuclease domain